VSEPRLRFFAEVMGLAPLSVRWRQAMVALRGQEDVPASRYDASSLSQLRPRIAVPLWMGRRVAGRSVLITNLFNLRQTPIEDGWSVKRTQVLDFRGRELTYDSHNGTDFAIPVGTTVRTAAAGEVVRVVSEFNRGGLKVFIDHGRGLMTCYAHLARAVVGVGDVLERGAPIALSGYSGLDGFVTFPWGVPHVHFNTWLNGVPICPFGEDGEASLWRAGELPRPPEPGQGEEPFERSRYDADRVEAAVEACKTPSSKERIAAVERPHLRAAELVAEMNYYPTRFAQRHSVYAEVHPREPRMDLPFAAADFEDVVFVDDR